MHFALGQPRGRREMAALAGVTFSDSNSTPVPKFLNLDPGLKIFQI